MKERRASQKLSSKSIMDPNQNVKCKIVVVGDSQCGKTALLHVFAKDCFPEVSVTRTSLRGAAGSLVWRTASFLLLHCFFFLKVFLMPSWSLTATLLGSESALEASLWAGTRQHPGLLAPETCWFQCGRPGGETWEGSREGAACLLCRECAAVGGGGMF